METVIVKKSRGRESRVNKTRAVRLEGLPEDVVSYWNALGWPALLRRRIALVFSQRLKLCVMEASYREINEADLTILM
ncbi:hypothetical protein EVAR_31481_1 [Eumeta japonica]|uniref:Uncharacterized protein n=1 Tax=Eumeta variegata TaxID=151549 RepID=A0A4C1WA81_EUMVA|nr:hypothetical protein EVAR_31481_1 [Eumeta japonica]